eukprot:TRINITY_DN88948_c0_g1_i1.p1 TRINITY_DN88948_c0_g1~~TRINITY_DN88948_c0_g1_i1.p1  ORF type:complete len:595 (-),score=132.85 TRINITY_DN88948_c0_g1_i1:72-1784(-)
MADAEGEGHGADPTSSSRTGASRAKAAAARRGTDTGPFPVFCRQRHFLRGVNVYAVPLWDLTSRWLPDELKPYASASSRTSGEAFAPPSRVAGSEQEAEDQAETAAASRDLDGDEDAAPSESDQSEVAWEGPLGGEDRAWSRAVVEGGLLLLRQIRSSADPDAPVAYGLGVSSALFSADSVAEGADAPLDRRVATVLRNREPHWAVLALRSGHFAGAIFKGQEATVHKAIHRYTVRAKAGGSQSAADSGKTIKSVGSSLRRYGETRLAEEIKELVTDTWASQLGECELIFVSVSKRMKSTLLGTEKEPFVSEKGKVRKLPFMVGKPTFEAVREAYLRVATVIFADEATCKTLTARFRPAPAAAAPAAPEKPAASAASNKAAATEGEVPVAKPYREDEDDLFTKLHAAAFADDEDQITVELDEGADPRSRDGKGRVPYYLCTTQRAREAFRRWRGANEDAWDWTAAQIPEGITDESEQKKKEKEKEKKKKQKDKAKASKAKAKEEEEERRQKEEEEQRALEAAQAKCDSCQKPLLSKPFTRLSYMYCSSDCVNAHRRELQAEAAMKRFGGP